ncbi:hypothetical protein M422DRAFT_56566 [Sphaerobolus stellatus SS14]|uniref:DUF4218 domain-containing protein n=1 Tax=Sphaerobolus stellatus (strain SS14) TaxID=990650 RepID=A0A0C9U4K6_SPHS4|nr:hypothetical protein M422DRAFT_56566 [Sphaerobolus stellatus SS14]
MDSKSVEKAQGVPQKKRKKSKIKPLDSKDLQLGEEALNKLQVSKSTLRKRLFSTLQELCQQKDIECTVDAFRNITKETMLMDLLHWKETGHKHRDTVMPVNSTGHIKPINSDELKNAQDFLQSSDLTENMLSHLKFATLEELCRQNRIPKSLNSYNRVTKATMTQDIYNWYSSGHRMLPAMSVEPLPVKTTTSSSRVFFIDAKSLLEIRKAIATMITPSWFPVIPQQFGSAKYMLLLHCRVWGKNGDAYSTHFKFLENTMNLVAAVLLAVSYETSELHAVQYTHYMQLYLKGLKELFPNMRFRNTHHIVLHIEELLNLLGPVHSWWMFPFERLIGHLQKMSTNWIIGQMELTIMQTFSAAANLRGFLFSGADIPGLHECVEIFKECFPGNTADTEESKGDLADDHDTEGELSELPHSLFIAFQAYMDRTRHEKINVLTIGHIRKRITYFGLVYSACHATIRDSLAMVEIDGGTVPVQIQSIFTGYHGSLSKPMSLGTFISVCRYPPADPVITDPYIEFSIWNARLHAKDTATQEVILPISNIRSHFAMMPFYAEHIVAIPLDKIMRYLRRKKRRTSTVWQRSAYTAGFENINVRRLGQLMCSSDITVSPIQKQLEGVRGNNSEKEQAGSGALALT